MDTVNRHRQNLLAQYKRADKAGAIVASAKKLARLILENNELLPPHRKKILKEVLWLISEADGKYRTRYRSAEVVRLACEVRDCEVPIQHEHVYPRASVADRMLRERDELLRDPEKLEVLLDQTIGCVVTRAEHAKLKSGEGWARYKDVRVLDMSTVPPKPRRNKAR